jgi:hypothetical protein
MNDFRFSGYRIATTEGQALPDKTYKHVALRIDNADFDMYLKRI